METSRPHMPAYGLLGPDEGRGLLPWSFARERLQASRCYWLSTVVPGGRPHAMPVWGVFEREAFFFSTDGTSRKARNLAADPRCVVTTDAAAEAVVLEGRAERVDDVDLLAEIAGAYTAKYPMGFPPDSHVFGVRPEVVFAFVEAHEEFAGSATRWRFDR